MHVIARGIFIEAMRKYPNDANAIEDFYRLLKNGKFKDHHELKRVVPSLDNFKYKDKWWVADLGGNNLRLIAFIEFRHQRVFVKYIVDHKEYDRLTDRYRRKELK